MIDIAFYVYRFMNSDNKVIYIGKTNSIETRMYQHKTNKMPFWKEWYKIEYVEFDSENEQLLYEILMINKFNPKYNSKDKFNATLDINDMRENDWKIYDEIRLYSDDEISEIYNDYINMNGSRRGCLKRSMNDKIKYARDEEEREIRSENYRKFMLMCQLGMDSLPEYLNEDLNIFETYHNGLGICDIDCGNPHSAKTLYIRNKNDEFQISGCGTVTMSREQLKIFIDAIMEKYELDKIA